MHGFLKCLAALLREGPGVSAGPRRLPRGGACALPPAAAGLILGLASAAGQWRERGEMACGGRGHQFEPQHAQQQQCWRRRYEWCRSIISPGAAKACSVRPCSARRRTTSHIRLDHSRGETAVRAGQSSPRNRAGTHPGANDDAADEKWAGEGDASRRSAGGGCQ